MKRIIAAFTLVSALAGAASADPPRKTFTQLFISPMGEPFRAGNGEPYPVEVWFKAADTDGDGMLTRDEFRADALRFFKTLDKDGDGVLDDEELKAYENHVAPEVSADINAAEQAEAAANQPHSEDRGTRDDAPTYYLGNGGSRIDPALAAKFSQKNNPLLSRRGAGKFSFLPEPDPVRGCDTNIDFRVSLREWMEAAEKRFSRLDTAHTGRIARADLPLTPLQLWLSGRR